MSNQEKDIQIHPSKQAKNEPDGSMANVVKNTIADQRHVDVTAMIRSLQRTEGVTDCFRRGISDCELPDCAWRKYCLGTQDGTSFKNDT